MLQDLVWLRLGIVLKAWTRTIERGSRLALPSVLWIGMMTAPWPAPGQAACTSENLSHVGSIQDGAGGAFLDGARSVFVEDGLAYVAAGADEALEILDVSDPRNPVHFGVIQHGGEVALRDPIAVFVTDGLAYVVSENYDSLEIVDVSDPARPVHVGALVGDREGMFSFEGPQSVYVVDGIAYVTAFYDSTLVLIDVSNPADPAVVSTFLIDRQPWGLFVEAGYAYVTGRHSDSLVIVDVSNPSAPSLAGTLMDAEGGAIFDSPTAVVVRDGYAYVAGDNDFEIVDVRDPSAPSHVGWTSTGLNGHQAGLFVSGGYAFIAASGTNSIEVVDIFNPYRPRRVATLGNGDGVALLGRPLSIFVDGDYAYVASIGSDTLEIIDVFDFAVDCPPTIEIVSPDFYDERADQNYLVEWRDSDDLNAVVTIFYDDDREGEDGVQIPTGEIREDDPTDSFLWDTSEMPNGEYYVYVKIDDGTQTAVDYSFVPLTIAHSTIPPTLTILEPDGVDDVADQTFTIRWSDEDPDSNATISLYYDSDSSGEDGTLIRTGPILEDDPADQWIWDTSAIPSGSYYIYAVIDDGTRVVSYSPGPVTIDRFNTPPTLTFLQPDGVDDMGDGVYEIRWSDEDPDSDAAISFFYDDDEGAFGSPIFEAQQIREDDEGDRFLWSTANLPEGEVYLLAVIDDGVNPPVSVSNPDPILIEHAVPSVWKKSGPLGVPREEHSATLLRSGKVLIAGGKSLSQVTSDVALYDPATGTWEPTGALGRARESHTATLLPSGDVLVVGGSFASRSAEIYDPGTEIWREVARPDQSWVDHTATLLRSGKVLIVGRTSKEAVLYDPQFDRWETARRPSLEYSSHTATLLPSGEVFFVGGREAGQPSGQVAEIYDPATGEWRTTGRLNRARDSHSATLLPTGEVLIAGGRIAEAQTAEIFDPETETWRETGSMRYPRMWHTANLLPSGNVLMSGGFGWPASGNAEIYDIESGTFRDAGVLDQQRVFHTSTLLPSGQVFLAGGLDSDAAPSSELYDPVAGAWQLTDAIGESREFHTSTLLASGEVLVAGGDAGGEGLSSVELYNAETGTWLATRSMHGPREQHTATLLLSGRVLVAGGLTPDFGFVASGEVFDPVQRIWSITGPMVEARYFHTATLLPLSRKVLVTGGHIAFVGEPTSSAELYDPVTRTWDAVASMPTPRERHGAVWLSPGKVLVVGGYAGNTGLSNAEIYDAETDSWTRTPPLNAFRQWPTVTRLPSGKVLVAGGDTGDEVLASAEIYDPISRTWTLVGSMNQARFRHTATLLPSGRVVVIGGQTRQVSSLLTAEVFDPRTGQWSVLADPAAPQAAGHTATLLATGSVLIVGESGTELLNPSDASEARRPEIETLPETLDYGIPFSVSGNGFRGDSEANGGTGESSATNYPLIHLQSLESSVQGYLTYDPARPEDFWNDPISLQVSDLPLSFMPGRYLFSVHNNGVSSRSRIAHLRCGVTIAQLPADQQGIRLGQSATFRVEAPGARSFQWQRFIGLGEPGTDADGYADIPGATGPAYTTPPVVAADSGANYRVKALGGCRNVHGLEAVQVSSSVNLQVFDDTSPYVRVLSPNGGEYLPLSEEGKAPHIEIIQWQMEDDIRICRVTVRLMYSNDGGIHYDEALTNGEPLLESGPGGTCAHPGEIRSEVLYEIPTAFPSGVQGSLYKIVVEVTDHAGNYSETSSERPFFIIEPGTSFKTLILSHPARMESSEELPEELKDTPHPGLQNALQDFANHPDVQGRIVDLGDRTDLNTLYDIWDANRGLAEPKPELANLVLFGCHGDPLPAGCNEDLGELDGIHDVIRELLAIHSDIQYLVLVGDDRVVPMARLTDRTVLFPEPNYVSDEPRDLQASLSPRGTTVGEALAEGFYLSDDPLASIAPVDPRQLLDEGNAFIPELAVGRLVETPEEIIASIATFISQGGVLDLREIGPEKLLVTAYDFLGDAGNRIAQRLERTIGPVSTLIHERDGDLPWTEEDLKVALCSLDGMASLNGHATHHEEGVPGATAIDIRGLSTAEIMSPSACGPDVPLDLHGQVLYAVGCHGGLPVAGSTAASDPQLDLPQAMLSRGAMVYLANSGYGWGLRQGVGYSERLVELFTEELTRAPRVEIGSTVRRAKLRYFLESPRFDVYSEKTLMQWTFFGFPMYAVETGLTIEAESPLDRHLEPRDEALSEKVGMVRVERWPGHGKAQVVGGEEVVPPDHLTPDFTRFTLSAEGVHVKYTASGLPVEGDGCPDPDGCYYTLNGAAEWETGSADLPIQPFFVDGALVSNTSLHGVLWLGGTYRQEESWIPVIAELVSNGGDGSAHGVLPRQIYRQPRGARRRILGDDSDCRATDTEMTSVVLTTGESLLGADGKYSIQRLYQTINFESFFFNNPIDVAENCDRIGPEFGPPTKGEVYHTINGPVVDWEVGMAEPEEVWRVVVVYDLGADEYGNGSWRPVELTESAEEPGIWRASELILGTTEISYMIQAVDQRGNVSWLEFDSPEPPASGADLELPHPIDVLIGTGSADLSVSVSEFDDPVQRNEQILYAVGVQNAGPDPASSVRVSGQPSAGASLILPGGDGWTCSLAETEGAFECTRPLLRPGTAPFLTVSASATNIGTVQLEVDVSTLDDDPRPENNAASETTTIIEGPSADLQILMFAELDSGTPQEVSYGITVTNFGPDAVYGAAVTNTFPPELMNIDWICQSTEDSQCTEQGIDDLSDTIDLEPQGQVRYTIAAELAPTAAGMLENTAEVSLPAEIWDPNLENNRSTSITDLGRASSEMIFESGFETGNFIGWSGDVPLMVIEIEDEKPTEDSLFSGRFMLNLQDLEIRPKKPFIIRVEERGQPRLELGLLRRGEQIAVMVHKPWRGMELPNAAILDRIENGPLEFRLDVETAPDGETFQLLIDGIERWSARRIRAGL